MRFPMFDAFDLPDMHNSCARRTQTITAPQALLLLNSDFTLERARHWAARLLLQHAADARSLIREAYRTAWGRQPTSEEAALGLQFLHTQAELAALFGSRSRASEVLKRRRALNVEMIHKISAAWKIPAELLVRPYKIKRAT